MVLGTLRAMALGGMRDHVGGGFHRYSVDGGWRVPHFEKMLYDQAQLVLALLEAWQVSGDSVLRAGGRRHAALRRARPDRRRTAGSTRPRTPTRCRPPQAGQAGRARHRRRVLHLVARRDRAGAGARRAGLGAALRRAAGRQRAVRSAGGVRQPQPVLHGADHRRRRQRHRTAAGGRRRGAGARAAAAVRGAGGPAAAAARRQGAHRLERADDRRLRARGPGAGRARSARRGPGRRPAPGTWPPRSAARRSCAATLWDEAAGRLRRRYAAGAAGIDGFAEDYACLAWGLLELFQADGDPAWLAWARTLHATLDRLFAAPDDAGWFATTGEDPSVLLRQVEEYRRRRAGGDVGGGDEPAGAGAADRRRRLPGAGGGGAAGAGADACAAQPRVAPLMLAALATSLLPAAEIAIVDADDAAAAQPLRDVVARRFLPSAVVVPVAAGAGGGAGRRGALGRAAAGAVRRASGAAVPRLRLRAADQRSRRRWPRCSTG